MPNHMEINCDAGELTREIDDSILPFVSACNVCCGAHAGDETLIKGTIAKAIQLGVKVGAHPSWPDRENFGRKSMDLPIDKLLSSLHSQICFVKSIVEDHGSKLHHVKPHGALYHDVLRRPDLAVCLLEVVASIDPTLSIYGMAGSDFANHCRERRIRFVHEGFGDRRYASRCRLRSRTESGALIESESDFRDHMKQLIRGSVIDDQGETHRLPIETICIHSDTPHAVSLAKIANDILGA